VEQRNTHQGLTLQVLSPQELTLKGVTPQGLTPQDLTPKVGSLQDTIQTLKGPQRGSTRRQPTQEGPHQEDIHPESTHQVSRTHPRAGGAIRHTPVSNPTPLRDSETCGEVIDS